MLGEDQVLREERTNVANGHWRAMKAQVARKDALEDVVVRDEMARNPALMMLPR